jgi:hypothetical protein
MKASLDITWARAMPGVSFLAECGGNARMEPFFMLLALLDQRVERLSVRE